MLFAMMAALTCQMQVLLPSLFFLLFGSKIHSIDVALLTKLI